MNSNTINHINKYFTNQQTQSIIDFYEKNKPQITIKNIKSFYKIINQINTIAEDLDQTLEYTEDNINDYTRHILGRELDSTEKMLLLSKLQNAKKNN